MPFMPPPSRLSTRTPVCCIFARVRCPVSSETFSVQPRIASARTAAMRTASFAKRAFSSSASRIAVGLNGAGVRLARRRSASSTRRLGERPSVCWLGEPLTSGLRPGLRPGLLPRPRLASGEGLPFAIAPAMIGRGGVAGAALRGSRRSVPGLISSFEFAVWSEVSPSDGSACPCELDEVSAAFAFVVALLSSPSSHAAVASLSPAPLLPPKKPLMSPLACFTMPPSPGESASPSC
mmetsp:Transcript_17131/g.53115  ORF Transcript_17131/g.53115 Transcript_17131/m.53115 type:complete len:236 (+) Transcript_17131:1311-2018(+)